MYASSFSVFQCYNCNFLLLVICCVVCVTCVFANNLKKISSNKDLYNKPKLSKDTLQNRGFPLPC